MAKISREWIQNKKKKNLKLKLYKILTDSNSKKELKESMLFNKFRVKKIK